MDNYVIKFLVFKILYNNFESNFSLIKYLLIKTKQYE